MTMLRELGRRARRPWWLGAVGVAATFALSATPAAAVSDNVNTQVSTDPFTNSTSQHATEVEPDTFAFGGTWVSAFQVGRFFDGGASDIGFATSSDESGHFQSGFLPGITPFTQPSGPYDRASDASVAFDLRDHVWLISFLAVHQPPGQPTGVVDVEASRSADGVHWDLPVAVAKLNTFLDKNWTVCDNSPSSPHFGNCYTEFDIASRRDLEQMTTSTDGGLTWGTPQATGDGAHGLGGQPLVQPNGRVVVPFEGVGRVTPGMRAFTSDDGGQTWGASVLISRIAARRVAGGAVRTSPLPTAEIDGQGNVYVVWQDCRFEAGCGYNDMVLSTSADGTTWSPVSRIPADPVGSNVDHFIPGLAVGNAPGNDAELALNYYTFPNASCTVATCQLEVAFVTSRNGGASWSQSQVITDPMNLSWVPETNQGFMVADYISTSFVVGQQARTAFAVASAPAAPGVFHQGMFSRRENVTGGDVQTANDALQFIPGTPAPGVDDGSDDSDVGI